MEIYSERPDSKLIKHESREVKCLVSMWQDLHVENSILYKRSKYGDTLRLVLPWDLRDLILNQVHGHYMTGHPGVSKAKSLLCPKFYWPGMRKDIERWVSCCRTCRQQKGGKVGSSPLTQDTVGCRNERVAFDIIGPLPRTERGNRFILTIVDYFSKWVEGIALPEHSAPSVAQAIHDHWFSRLGIPESLHSDQAPEFESKVFTELNNMLQIHKTRTNPYRPRSNGLAERSNQTIEKLLRCLIRDNRCEWDLHLQSALMAYRATPHASTGCTPNLLMFGNENNMPLDLLDQLEMHTTGPGKASRWQLRGKKITMIKNPNTRKSSVSVTGYDIGTSQQPCKLCHLVG